LEEDAHTRRFRTCLTLLQAIGQIALLWKLFVYPYDSKSLTWPKAPVCGYFPEWEQQCKTCTFL
jgi:hypothetical protein